MKYTEPVTDHEEGYIMFPTKPVKELRIWFNDDSMLVATGDHAAVTTMELHKYARTGFPYL